MQRREIYSGRELSEMHRRVKNGDVSAAVFAFRRYTETRWDCICLELPTTAAKGGETTGRKIAGCGDVKQSNEVGHHNPTQTQNARAHDCSRHTSEPGERSEMIEP
eukprot:4922-Rhodomonas_salina.1